MRVLGRIGFALLAVFTFWFAIDYARGAMTLRYFENEGKIAVDENDDSFFYGSARDYNQKGALYTITEQGYTISFYEIADVDTKSGLVVNPYIYIILRSDDRLDDTHYMKLIGGETDLELEFYPFRTLNIRMALNEELQEFGIKDEKIINKGYQELQLLDQYKNIVFEVPFEINEDQMILESKITSYYEVNNQLPFTALTSENVFPKITHEMDNYMHIMYISLGVYVFVLIVSIYIVFFMKKKFLGKKKPSDILIKESPKYKKGD